MATKRVGDQPLVRRLLIGAVTIIAAFLIAAPLLAILSYAFAEGASRYFDSLFTPDTLNAIKLSVITALIAVPINTLFGIAAAWAIAKFEFPGRRFLTAIIELPYSISPIVAGVAYLFVYGAQGLFGPLLQANDIKIMFALPGIVLASLFVTAPFVARELIPLLETQGREREEASISLGASGFQTFWRISLPGMKWALLYGVILCNARVFGEFGAVSIVSGNVRGETNTLPLQVELLYQDHNSVGAFAAASVLMLVAVFTLIAKFLLERQGVRRQAEGA
ncbi:MAG TPA: sulfate ABC transporter permease subunit CysW [Nordella sp.]|nr:sulfate ABC transporter permease subunit CysW [Nordella sp.]